MPVHPTHSYTHKDYLSLSLFSFLFHLTHIYTSMPVGNRSYSTTLGPFSFIRPSPLSLTHTHSYILFLSLFSHFFSFMTPYPPLSLSRTHTHTMSQTLEGPRLPRSVPLQTWNRNSYHSFHVPGILPSRFFPLQAWNRNSYLSALPLSLSLPHFLPGTPRSRLSPLHFSGTAISLPPTPSLSFYLELLPLDCTLCRPGTGTAIFLPLLSLSLYTWNSSL